MSKMKYYVPDVIREGYRTSGDDLEGCSTTRTAEERQNQISDDSDGDEDRDNPSKKSVAPNF